MPTRSPSASASWERSASWRACSDRPRPDPTDAQTPSAIRLEPRRHSESDSYNQNLSQERADSVKNWMVRKKAIGSVLTARGRGSRPRRPERESGRQRQPRRASEEPASRDHRQEGLIPATRLNPVNSRMTTSLRARSDARRARARAERDRAVCPADLDRGPFGDARSVGYAANRLGLERRRLTIEACSRATGSPAPRRGGVLAESCWLENP